MIEDMKKLDFESSFQSWLCSNIVNYVNAVQDLYGMNQRDAEKYMAKVFEGASISVLNILNGGQK